MVLRCQRVIPRKIDTPKRKVTAPSHVPKPPKNKKIFHGKPVPIDVEGISNNSLTTNPIAAPDLRKKVDPDLLKGVGYLLGSIPEDSKK